MSKISIDLIWKLEDGAMSPGKYSNKHEITFTPNTITYAVPEDSDLEITYKDEENIKKLKEQINEFISCRDSNNP